ncbi:hypothetical protein GTY75_11585 [Streptomyces sp. SID8381]|uniref:DUF6234 family protein n=1 Tax=unclassified Streptomyces TaxID=2593676 RepID=UPI000362612D|nr:MULTISPECIES: DUF6234 family protein [unclassified Streptomyces]MYX27287.1 hypothetical protein [Streptomyces sp. SID8381]
MNLPIAPPAFDTTTEYGRHARADRGADIGAGCCLTLLELIALLAVFWFWFLSVISDGPGKTPETESLWGYPAVVIGVVGALAVVAALIAARVRAVVTFVSQSVMAVLVCVVLFGGYTAQSQEDAHCDTAPSACHR